MRCRPSLTAKPALAEVGQWAESVGTTTLTTTVSLLLSLLTFLLLTLTRERLDRTSGLPSVKGVWGKSQLAVTRLVLSILRSLASFEVLVDSRMAPAQESEKEIHNAHRTRTEVGIRSHLLVFLSFFSLFYFFLDFSACFFLDFRRGWRAWRLRSRQYALRGWG